MLSGITSAQTDTAAAAACPVLSFLSFRDQFTISSLYVHLSERIAMLLPFAHAASDPDTSSVFSAPDFRAQFADTHPLSFLLLDLNQQYLESLSFLMAVLPAQMPGWFATLALHLSSFAVRLSQPNDTPSLFRDNSHFLFHYEYAQSHTPSTLLFELANRTATLFAALDGPASGSGIAKQVLPSKTFPKEYTTIPTGGFAWSSGKEKVAARRDRNSMTTWTTDSHEQKQTQADLVAHKHSDSSKESIRGHSNDPANIADISSTQQQSHRLEQGQATTTTHSLSHSPSHPHSDSPSLSLLYMFFMSVAEWGPPGVWTSNFGGVATSRDGGKTFVRTDNLFAGDSNFVQIAAAQHPGDTTWVYLFGVPSGRFGSLRLARAPPAQLAVRSAYQFCSTRTSGSDIPSQSQTLNDGPSNSLSSAPSCTWVAEESAASELLAGPLDVPSVTFNPYLNAFMLTYFNTTRYCIEMRTAPDPWGPFSPASILVNCSSPGMGGCYGGFTSDLLLINEGKSFFFTLSLWPAYNTFWVRADLA